MLGWFGRLTFNDWYLPSRQENMNGHSLFLRYILMFYFMITFCLFHIIRCQESFYFTLPTLLHGPKACANELNKQSKGASQLERVNWWNWSRQSRCQFVVWHHYRFRLKSGRWWIPSSWGEGDPNSSLIWFRLFFLKTFKPPYWLLRIDTRKKQKKKVSNARYYYQESVVFRPNHSATTRFTNIRKEWSLLLSQITC